MKLEKEKKPTKAEQACIRRNQIIDTALKLFAEKGFGNTTIKDISEAAGTSLGLMYHYFASKDELLIAVFERHSFLESLRNILKFPCNKPVSEVLFTLASGFYNLLTTKKELVNIIFNEMRINPAFNKIWCVITAEGIELIRGYLDNNISSGNLKPHNPEVTARIMIHTIIMYFISQDLFPESKLTTEQYLRQTVDIFLEGIAAKPQ